MPELLLVDDEPSIQHAFRHALQKDDLKLRFASTAAEAVAEFRRARPNVVVLDVRLPDATGLETFRRLRDLDARVPVILITGHGTTELAIQAIKEGAFEYLLKPVELPQFRETLDRALRSSAAMRTPAAMPEVEEAPVGGDLLLGRCPAMQEVYKAIGRVAGQDVTVLILGESGTGKELIARAIYQHSHRSQKPFLAINHLEGIGPDQLRIKELLRRLGEEEVDEVILCTNPNLDGEATAMYLARLLKNVEIKVSRIASGLPVGGDLEYADELTLGRALEGRRVVET